MAQDVRVPLAIVLQTTINYMKDYGYTESANITPFLNNLLHAFTNLHHVYKPVFKRFKYGEKPWLPKPENQTEKVYVDGTTIVNNLTRITAERRAFEQYSTDHATPMFKDQPRLFRGDHQKQAERNWEGHELPRVGSSLTWSRFCHTCGANRHKKCTLREENLAKCIYPLCNCPELSHTVKVCKALHRWCSQCGMRGHFIDSHKQFCHEVLQRVFLKWAPFGIYTSLVYLHPNREDYWKFFINGEEIIDYKVAKEARIDLHRP